MIAKEKIIGLIIISILLILYWYLDIFESDISIIIKLIPFIALNIYIMNKTKNNK